MKIWKLWMTAALLGGAMGSGLPAVQAETTDEKLQELDQKVKVLERKLEIADENAQAKAKEGPVVTASKDGFGLASGDGAFKLKLRGYVQGDGRFYLDDADKKIADTFLIRRARLVFEGTIYKQMDFRITPELTAGSTTLFDAYLDYKPASLLSLRVGKFKVPFGVEQLQSDTDNSFAERGLTSDLQPNRDVGVLLYGDLGSNTVVYSVGVVNGAPDGANVDSDINDGKDFAGRVFVQPFKNGGNAAISGLGFGVAASAGDQQGSATASGLPSFKTVGQQTIFSYKSSATNADDNVIADGSHTRIAPLASYYGGPVSLIGEYVQSSQDVKKGATDETLDNEAWQVIAAVVLTGEKASPKGIVPLAAFDPAQGSWGAFELVARYGELSVDDSAFTTYADPKKSVSQATDWGVGVNWYLNKVVRLALDYDQTQFDGGAADGDRPDENILLARVQFNY